MPRDGEIAAIFNPRRVRAPSVVVTGDSPNGPFSGFTNVANTTTPQLIHSDSIASGHPDTVESIVCIQNNASTPTADTAPTLPNSSRSSNKCKDSCCSELAQKMYFGVCVTILVTASWVGATHCIKFLYIRRSSVTHQTIISDDIDSNSSVFYISKMTTIREFNAPFFASWFCTNFAILFFPIYLLGRIAVKKCESPSEMLGDVLRGLRDRGFTPGRFFNRCITFCVLWQLTTYLYALSLRALLATDVMALFATNVACAYLLSWVILHEQFVGVRVSKSTKRILVATINQFQFFIQQIVAVIMCDTGIALLAYMDGITGSPTLGGVVLAVLSAAGYAVFKVMFRKVMREPPVGQVAFTFTILGFINASLIWPVCLALYFSGTESMPWERVSWIILLIASVLMLVFHILTQFSAAVTYNLFVTLGLITSVPVSAALDVVLYGANFAGMKLAGVVLISIGFFLVMFPNNWPDYITRLIRKTGRAILRNQCCCEFAEIDYDKSKYHLVGSFCEAQPSL
ncbi:putative thiamine transporter SLC35F3 isoform X4 [Bradysia coprophila]|uniref:putative thiamine transporter SLC35F3 isoform X4 n=1 Tax=Bradysia coprophila TaxID=38358 RepID=UPI00187D98C1|nr:putative thiamine transporter SLC35F3 isoform X4 [Bradysia coprophila]XP_037051675.1 putative thiamine transporter SLC35F3 isoform X4 [Bradysia coprophila]XP_037051684.1 putative thiamine transporter SLC35F3 isoform X4 [Bradysia coprophila]